MGYHYGIDGKGSKTKPLVLPERVMKLREETYQIIKEHSWKYYSTGLFDEIFINLVEFYEQNQGPSHKYD